MGALRQQFRHFYISVCAPLSWTTTTTTNNIVSHRSTACCCTYIPTYVGTYFGRGLQNTLPQPLRAFSLLTKQISVLKPAISIQTAYILIILPKKIVKSYLSNRGVQSPTLVQKYKSSCLNPSPACTSILPLFASRFASGPSNRRCRALQGSDEREKRFANPFEKRQLSTIENRCG